MMLLLIILRSSNEVVDIIVSVEYNPVYTYITGYDDEIYYRRWVYTNDSELYG